MTDDLDPMLDPGGYYDFSGYAQPDHGPRQRDRLREQAQRIAVETYVSRGGPITEDTHATQTPAPVATDRGVEGSGAV